MNIPNNFYFRFWLKNYLMALVLGFALGYAVLIAIVFGIDLGIILYIFMALKITPGVFFIIFPALVVLIYQLALYQYFWGKNKGHFEYYYREFLVDQAAKSLINDFINDSRQLVLDHPEKSFRNPDLLSYPNVKTDPNLQFLANLVLSRNALRRYDYDKEVEYLRVATSLKPSDLVANYWLGNALERVGDSPGAIRAYQAALTDPLIDSGELKKFIVTQIMRVETQGPAKKPPIPGFRYFI